MLFVHYVYTYLGLQKLVKPGNLETEKPVQEARGETLAEEIKHQPSRRLLLIVLKTAANGCI